MSVLGSRVRELRKEKNLTLQELARLVSEDIGREIHYTTLGKIERSERRPSGDILISVANALNCTVHYLTGRTLSYANEFQVPVLSWTAVANWEDALKEEQTRYVFSNINSPSAFALELDELDDIEGEDVDTNFQLLNAFVVVQPKFTELRDGHAYLISSSGGKLSIDRFRAEPPRFETGGLTSRSIAGPIGSQPFQVIGRVGWVSGSI